MTNRDLEHLRELMDERDIRYQQRHEASETALAAALLAVNERLALLNELRDDVATEASVTALAKIVDLIVKKQERTEGVGQGRGAMFGWLIAAIGLISTIMTIIIIFTR